MDYWRRVENVEELALIGEMDYENSFNIFCLLDPESRVNYLSVERYADPIDWAYDTQDDRSAAVYFDSF